MMPNVTDQLAELYPTVEPVGKSLAKKSVIKLLLTWLGLVAINLVICMSSTPGSVLALDPSLASFSRRLLTYSLPILLVIPLGCFLLGLLLGLFPFRQYHYFSKVFLFGCSITIGIEFLLVVLLLSDFVLHPS